MMDNGNLFLGIGLLCIVSATVGFLAGVFVSGNNLSTQCEQLGFEWDKEKQECINKSPRLDAKECLETWNVWDNKNEKCLAREYARNCDDCNIMYQPFVLTQQSQPELPTYDKNLLTEETWNDVVPVAETDFNREMTEEQKYFWNNSDFSQGHWKCFDIIQNTNHPETCDVWVWSKEAE